MKADESFRSVEASAMASRDALNSLTRRNEQDLYAALGTSTRNETAGRRLGVDDLVRGPVANTPFDIGLDIDDFYRDDETVALGQRVFRRWSEVLHGFVCKPGQEDQELRARVASAIFGKDMSATALVAAALVSLFKVSAFDAAIIAALLINLIGAPAADEVCQAWGKTIDERHLAPPSPGRVES